MKITVPKIFDAEWVMKAWMRASTCSGARKSFAMKRGRGGEVLTAT